MARKKARSAHVLIMSLVLCACAGSDADDSPTEVLSRFLDAMDRSASSQGALADAYVLLDTHAKHQLHARAQHASLVSGRDFEPWQMLAQGRFRLRFAPADHGGLKAKVDGDSAVVHVTSSDRESRADVPMVREQGRWRVKLALPDGHAAVQEPSKAQ